MAANKPPKTLADYLAIAISPALIMALVGSLVFFLVAVLYKGDFTARLNWILFFFVFGAVLIARISMTGGIADRARLYGFVLGLLVWIGLLLYVDWGTSPLAPFGWAIDLGLIAIIWWCAHRLTWDCTLIDDAVDASGAGLLQEAGLEGKADQAASVKEVAGEGTEEDLPGLMGWFARYRRYRREKERKPHAPGVWVVYFSLAALPLYGLGQALIDVDDLPRRRYAFWLMTIYVASGLGLLLATSFLGLRRYLRQRGLKMPMPMTGAWLTVGGMLIGAFLLVGALLPRPHAEVSPIRDLLGEGVGAPERKSSQFAEGRNPGKDEGRPANDKPPKGAKDKGGNDKGGKDQGDPKDKDGGGKDKDSSGKDKDGKQKDKGGNQKDKDGSNRDKDSKADKKEGEKQTPNRPGKSDGSREGGQGSREAPTRMPHSNIPEWGKKLGTILKWVVAGIVVLVVLFLLLRNGLKFLANFTHWARRLLKILSDIWRGLWGWWGGRSGGEQEAVATAAVVEPKPFASFRDPFLFGGAESMSPEQLVRYSFEALQAWAWERGLGRQTGETPLEFARRLGEEVPALEAEARQLAHFYAQIAYARGTLTRACREPLRCFWQLLVEAVEKPMSAGVG
jgi:Domain of unknown function (DUF4129)